MKETRQFVPEEYSEEKKPFEAERKRVERAAEEEANLRNKGESPRNKLVASGLSPKETAKSVMHGDALAENQTRDYEKLTDMKVEHDYPGSIQDMEKFVATGGRYSMDVYLFGHRSAKTDEDKTRIFELYKKQGVNPHEGASRAHEAEMIGLQMEVENRLKK